MLDSEETNVRTRTNDTRGLVVLEGNKRAVRRPLVPFSLLLLRPSSGAFLQAGCLTPYVMQTIIREALRAGRRSHLFVTLAPDTPEEEVKRVARQLRGLRDRGVRVTVSRGAVATRQCAHVGQSALDPPPKVA